MGIRFRHRHSGSGPRGMRAAALIGMVALVASACSNQSSSKDLKALLDENQRSPQVSVPETGNLSTTPVAPAPETAAPGPDSAPAALGASAPTPSASASASATPAPRTAARATKIPSKSSSGSPAATPSPAGAAAGPAADAAAEPAPASPGAPTPAVPGAAAPARCTGSEPPINIGSVGQFSGPIAYAFTDGARTVAAWAADLNEKGGLNCHKIKFVMADSGGDPARFQAETRKLVEREGVQTFVQNGDNFGGYSANDYLDEKGIPVIGGVGGEMWMYDRWAMQFPVISMDFPLQVVHVHQAARLLVPKGLKKLGTAQCVEAVWCPTFKKTVKEYASKFGFELVYQADIGLTSPDYTAFCLEGKNRGVQAWLTAADAQTNQRFVNSCTKLGMKTPISVIGPQGNDDFKDNPSMAGSQIVMNTLPWFLENHPAIAEYQRVVRKHGLALEPQTIEGWTSAKAFEHAVRKASFAPSQPFTAKVTLEGLYALNGDTLDGLTYPLHFRPGQPKKKIACGTSVEVENGKFTSSHPDLSCAPGFEP